MLRNNRGVYFNWNALVAAAETTNKLSLRMKTALFTDLRYFLPLVEGLVHMLVPSKARNRPAVRSSLNMHAATTFVLRMRAVAVYLLGTAKSE